MNEEVNTRQEIFDYGMLVLTMAQNIIRCSNSHVLNQKELERYSREFRSLSRTFARLAQ